MYYTNKKSFKFPPKAAALTKVTGGLVNAEYRLSAFCLSRFSQ